VRNFRAVDEIRINLQAECRPTSVLDDNGCGSYLPIRAFKIFRAIIKIRADAVCCTVSTVSVQLVRYYQINQSINSTSVICSHQMPDFSAKMHQIQFRLDPAGGAYSAPPDLLASGEWAVCPSQEPHPRSRPFGPRYSLLPRPHRFSSINLKVKIRLWTVQQKRCSRVAVLLQYCTYKATD